MELKGPFKNYQVSINYNGVYADRDVSPATWDTLGTLADDGSSIGSPTQEDFPLFDGGKRRLGEENEVVLAALDLAAAGVVVVKAAATSGGKVWLRATNDAGQDVIFGGADGCEVGYALPPFAKKNKYITPIMTFSAGSSQPAGTVQYE